MLFKIHFSVYFISINRSNTRHLHFYLVEQISVCILEFSYILCNWVLKLTYIGSYWVGGWNMYIETCYILGEEVEEDKQTNKKSERKCAPLCFVLLLPSLLWSWLLNAHTFNQIIYNFRTIILCGINLSICILITVSEQLIEETSFSGVILPSPEWNTLDHIGKNARITYR